MAVYEITSPTGQVLEIEGDSPPSEAELDEIFKATGNNTSPALPQEESTPVLQGGVTKNVNLTPSGIAEGAALNTLSALGAPLYALKNRESLPQAFQDVKNQYIEDRANLQEQYPQLKNSEDINKAAMDFTTYGLMPSPLKGGGLGKQMLNSALQGGIIAGAESTKNNGLGLQNIKDSALGAGIGAVLPPVLKSGGAIIKNGLKIVPATGNLIAKSLGRIKPETLQRAVQADSVALDLTEPQAQNLLMNTTEDIQRGYKNLLDKAGRDVQYAAMKLPEDRGVWASSLKDSLDDIYAGYSTSGNKALNPAYNNAGDIYNDIKSLIDAGAIDVKTGQPITANSIDGKISAAKLNDIMSNIKNYPIEWNKTTSKDRQAILKQVYGDFSRRLNNLSPELRKANKAFSELAKFDDNEGVRQIIKPDIIRNESIDSASRALKNYNSTVTKGNTNRNIQDLEKILVKNGYEPFIKKIDDINAAMDLLNNRTTGDSWLANITTNATKPVLKGVRGVNRFVQNNPNVQKTISNLKELNPGLYNLLLQGAGRLAGSKK